MLIKKFLTAKDVIEAARHQIHYYISRNRDGSFRPNTPCFFCGKTPGAPIHR